jgi:CheY-like chemotaxis protein
MIFLDLKMPGTDGFDVLKEIRGKLGCQNVPIIVFTNSDFDTDKAAAYDLGASSFHTKPSHYKDLPGLLQSVIDSWSPSNPAHRPTAGS